MTSTDGFRSHFKREWEDAKVEWLRLCHLFKDVCWYNFEVVCRDWEDPWRSTELDSRIDLEGMSFRFYYNKGKRREHGHFPVWYSGSVRDAPTLPPTVIIHELKSAERYMRRCERQLTACEDWAPGGRRYEALRACTLVGKELVQRADGSYRQKRKFSHA